MYLDKSFCETNYSLKYNTQVSGLGATRANLLRLLRSIDLVGWSTHEESGRLDRKALTRFACGSTAVFSRRQAVEAERSAVSVLIDCSGSMSDGGAINTAESVVIQLARILDKANVEFSVTGFHGNKSNVSSIATGANSDELYARYEAPTLIPFKQWNEPLVKCAAKLGSIHRWADSSTPDYSSISLTVDELSKRSEQRKVLFLITDADGYNTEHMKYLQRVADKLGVKIVAIGIGSTDVKLCFRSSDDVKNVNDLASVGFNKIIKEVK